MLKMLLVSFLTFCSVLCTGQTFRVKSVSPSENSVLVPLNQHLSIRFSEPLDLTNQANWEDSYYSSPVPFISVVVKSQDPDEWPVYGYQINDSATVLTLLCQFTENKTYQIRLWDARSTAGNELIFYSGFFTTGAVLPAATVSGTITGGFNPETDYVMLFPSEVRLFGTNLHVLIDAYRMEDLDPDGSFSFTVVEPGDYQAVLVVNGDNDPLFDYQNGDNIGIFDANSDSRPDKITVSGQEPVSGITFGVFEMTLSGSGPAWDAASAFASNWNPEAKLMMIQGLRDCDTTGVTDSWGFIFQEPGGMGLQILGSGTSILLSEEAESGGFDDDIIPGIYPKFLSSDQVAGSLRNHLRQQAYYHPSGRFRFEMALVSGLMMKAKQTVTAPGFFSSGPQIFSGYGKSSEMEIPEYVKPYWYTRVFGEVPVCKGCGKDTDPEPWESVISSGFTGHIIRMESGTASSAFHELNSDLKWMDSPDKIVALFSMSISDTGTSYWAQLVKSPGTGRYSVYITMGNMVYPVPVEVPFDFPPYINREITGEWLDSDAAMEIVKAELSHQGGEMSGFKMLTLMNENQIFPRDTSLYWYFTAEIPEGRIASGELNRENLVARLNSLFDYRFSFNARTGEIRQDSVIHVKDRLTDAVSIAQKWSPNAKLFNIETAGRMTEKGVTAWVYDFKRPLLNDYLRVFLSAEDELELPVFIPAGIPAENEDLPMEFIGDDSVSAVQEIYGEIDGRILTAGLMGVKGHPVWILKPQGFSDPGGDNQLREEIPEEELLVYLDGKTGRRIDTLDLKFNERTGLRAAYGSMAVMGEGKILKAVRAENIDSTGLARVWRYVWSLDTGEILMVLTHGNQELPLEANEMEEGMDDYINSIPQLKPGWIGSEAVANSVVNYLKIHPFEGNVTRVSATLLTGAFPGYSYPTDPLTEYWFVEFRTEEGNDTIVVVKAATGEIYTSAGKEEITPRELTLSQNYPNPFNPETRFDYSIPSGNTIRLSVISVTGQEVAVIENGFKPAGTYSVVFSGSSLASGLYFCKLESGGKTVIRKLVLIR
ncbi:MAG: T9SS type A sorting domain-containing protein [Bacteroidetes bacterium]|nr:T9SS type A sorting domain-containing protein [Bacteroidota bacterium]